MKDKTNILLLGGNLRPIKLLQRQLQLNPLPSYINTSKYFRPLRSLSQSGGISCYQPRQLK